MKSLRTYALVGGAALLAAGLAPSLPSADGLRGQETVRLRAPDVARSGWLGVRVLEEVGVDRAGAFSSVTISDVMDGGPAERAGLRAGDRVVRVDGRPATPALFNRVASALAPGDVLELTVERHGESVEVAVTAGAPPREVTVSLAPEMAERVRSKLRSLDSVRVLLATGDSAPRPPGSARARIVTLSGAPRAEEPPAPRPLLPWLEGRSWVAGARFTELNPDLAAYFGVERGLLVTEVIEGTPLPRAGVRPGDVVTALEGRPLRSLDDLRAAMAVVPDGDGVLTVVRRGEAVELRLER